MTTATEQVVLKLTQQAVCDLSSDRLRMYESLEGLVKGYAIHMMLGQADLEERIAFMVARTKYSYQPHLYRGGYVIPGFGFSVERIGKWVTAEHAGCPELVKKPV